MRKRVPLVCHSLRTKPRANTSGPWALVRSWRMFGWAFKVGNIVNKLKVKEEGGGVGNFKIVEFYDFWFGDIANLQTVKHRQMLLGDMRISWIVTIFLWCKVLIFEMIVFISWLIEFSTTTSFEIFLIANISLESRFLALITGPKIPLPKNPSTSIV